jgi:MHS family alpha-ketoglutarate permease-like MFS transporter
MPKFLVNTAGYSKEDSTIMSLIMIVSFMVMQPIVGASSDKIGRKPILITFGVLGSLFSVPLLNAIAASRGIAEGLMFVLAGLVISSFYSATNAVVKAELFPVQVRAAGIGIPYSIVVAIFGGSAEYVGLRFKVAGWEQGFYYYISACMFISLLVYFFMKETRSVPPKMIAPSAVTVQS